MADIYEHFAHNVLLETQYHSSLYVSIINSAFVASNILGNPRGFLSKGSDVIVSIRRPLGHHPSSDHQFIAKGGRQVSGRPPIWQWSWFRSIIATGNRAIQLESLNMGLFQTKCPRSIFWKSVLHSRLFLWLISPLSLVRKLVLLRYSDKKSKVKQISTF